MKLAVVLLACIILAVPVYSKDKPKPQHPCDVRDRHGKKPKKVKQGRKKVPREWVCDDSPDRDNPKREGR